MLTLSQRRSWARHGDREIQRTIDQAKAELLADEQAEVEAKREAYEQKYGPKDFTPEELKAATHVRTDVGWHKVSKVNAKSVTVETGYSWTDRYAISKVLEVRTITTTTE